MSRGVATVHIRQRSITFGSGPLRHGAWLDHRYRVFDSGVSVYKTAIADLPQALRERLRNTLAQLQGTNATG